jgi:glutathione S-transferase
MQPTITTFAWIPDFARGFVRDIRLRWACEEVGQPYQVALVHDPKTPDHRRIQPFGQIPTYTDDEVEIFESGAIVLRIAERGGALLPSETAARARAIQWLIAALNTIEPRTMQIAVVHLFEADKPWSPMRRDQVIADLNERLDDLSAALGDKTWLDGDTFTVGDLMMVSVLGMLRNSDLLAPYPNLTAYVARGEARPAHRKAMADHLATYDNVEAPAAA